MKSKIGWMNAERGDDSDDDGDAGAEDAFPELVEMLQKRHLPFGQCLESSICRRHP